MADCLDRDRWSYKPVLGTGLYKAGNTNIALLRLPPSYDLSGNPDAHIHQRPNGGQDSQGFLLYESGLDYTHSIGLTALGKPLSLGTFVLWRHFGNHLKFAGIDGEQVELKKLYSVGLTLGFNGPVDWHHIPLHRIGLSLVRGDNLKAISVNLGFPF